MNDDDMDRLRNILMQPRAVSYPMTAEYERHTIITKDEFVRAMEILYGTNHHLTSETAIDTFNGIRQTRGISRQPHTFEPPNGYHNSPYWQEITNPCKEEPIMSERIPKRAKIVRLLGDNETEDEIYLQYVGMTFDVVGEGSTYKNTKGYRLCLDKNDHTLNAVRFGVDELELYYDDESAGGEY